MRIIGERLGSSRAAFEDDAVEYCARKVGAVSGDARRAIALSKRALNWLTTNGQSKVGIREMEQAIQHSMSTSPVQIIGSFGIFDRALLLGILLMSRQGIPCLVDSVLEHCIQLTRSVGISEARDWQSLLTLLNDLMRMGILRSVANKGGPLDVVVTLAVSEEDLVNALRVDPILGRFVTATEVPTRI
jgi:origin recognition complex subunit 1